MQRLFIFAIITGLGLYLEPALGLGQQLQNSARQERREKRQVEALVDEGARLLKAGRTILAAEKFHRALQFDAGNDRAHAYLAQIAWDERRVEIAKSHAIRALKSNPQNTRAHLIASEILLQEGKTLAAFDHLRKASANVSNDQEKRKVGKLLANLREKHPAWFGKALSSTTPSIPVAATSANSSTSPATDVASAAPMKPAATGVRPNLAVFTFAETSAQQTAQGWGASLAEMLTTALINSGNYRIIERKQLEKVLEEQALGQSGALDSETAVVVGKIMSLDAVVIGSISALASTLEADARILNVETGEAIAAAHSRATSADDLRQMAEVLAKDISQRAAVVPVRAQADTAVSSQK